MKAALAEVTIDSLGLRGILESFTSWFNLLPWFPVASNAFGCHIDRGPRSSSCFQPFEVIGQDMLQSFDEQMEQYRWPKLDPS